MTKSLKLPPEKRDEIWSLTSKEYMFLDLTLMLNLRNSDIYRMVYGGQLTDAQYSTRSSAVVTSNDAKEYIAIRRKQLEDYYFPPNDGTESSQIAESKAKSNEEMLAELIPDVVRGLKDIARDKNDENYGDLVKAVLSKLMKDMDTKNAANPPMRYLPEIPCAQCRYKLFCENETTDECEWCKYKKYGVEHGLTYDYKNQLEKNLENG